MDRLKSQKIMIQFHSIDVFNYFPGDQHRPGHETDGRRPFGISTLSRRGYLLQQLLKDLKILAVLTK